MAIVLLGNYPEATDAPTRAALRDAVATYDRGWSTIAQAYSQRSTLSPQKIEDGLGEGDTLFRQSTDQVATVLDRLPAVTVGETVSSGTLSVPFETAELLLKRRTGNKSPRFLERTVDLSSRAPIQIDVSSATDFYCLLEFAHAPPGSSQFELSVRAGPDLLGKVDLSVTVPEKYPLEVQIVDSDDHPVDAAVGLYSAGDRFLVPASALDFSAAGYFYQPVRYRESTHTRYWPGGENAAQRFLYAAALRSTCLREPTGSSQPRGRSTCPLTKRSPYGRRRRTPKKLCCAAGSIWRRVAGIQATHTSITPA